MAENSRKNEFFERESIAIIAITREKIIILPNFKYSRQKITRQLFAGLKTNYNDVNTIIRCLFCSR